VYINPLHACDFYKTSHRDQYPKGTTLVYSNLTPRSDKLARIPGFTGEVTWFGLQFFLKEFLQETWDEGFFKRPKYDVVAEYRRRMDSSLGKGVVDAAHIEQLHDLGYLPICIKALPEGTAVPIKVPCMVVYNTLPEFFWLTNYLETALSAYLWKPTTSATIARHYRLLLEKYADLTGADREFVQFQGHDFSCRGMSGMQDAALTGAGHLTSFVGTDTIPAIDLAERYYNADATQTLVGTSVPASEHSVMCMGGKDDELGTFRRFVTELYPHGVVSIVSDTWDLWKVVSEYVGTLKPEILAREGKLVIRPDSGDPVEIICGKPVSVYPSLDDALDQHSDAVKYKINEVMQYGGYGPYRYADRVCTTKDGQVVHWDITFEYRLSNGVAKSTRAVEWEVAKTNPADLGVVENLWNVFGGTINEKGYKVLDPHIGVIYGDSITLERAEAILKGLAEKGFASSNVVFGVGSYTYQMVTRDTFGFAVKATAGAVDGVVREIYKDPVTDGGTKKSARGFLTVQLEDGKLVLHDRQPSIDTPGCQLREVFRDGVLLVDDDFETIRQRAQS
jgi:nicotinamide phosphoribosyltransferase